MQVISGLYKNRPLVFPKKIRPSTQKHKKVVFDTIFHDLPDSTILDLFSGSGQMGIEALSLNAKHITFVDQDRESIKCINENLTKLSIDSTQFRIHQGDINRVLIDLQSKFDIIISDPPYFETDWQFLNHLSRLAKANTILVVKYSPHNPPPTLPNWHLAKQKDLSDTIINFYLYQND